MPKSRISKKASPKSTFSRRKPSVAKRWRQIVLGVIVLLIASVGVVSAVWLAQSSQELRQQAAGNCYRYNAGTNACMTSNGTTGGCQFTSLRSCCQEMQSRNPGGCSHPNPPANPSPERITCWRLFGATASPSCDTWSIDVVNGNRNCPSYTYNFNGVTKNYMSSASECPTSQPPANPPANPPQTGTGNCSLCNRQSDCAAGFTCTRLVVGYRCINASYTGSCREVPEQPGGDIPSTIATCTGDCCTLNGRAQGATNCYVVLNQCPGGEIPCNRVVSTTSDGTQCMSSTYTGSQQVDVRCPNRNPLFIKRAASTTTTPGTTVTTPTTGGTSTTPAAPTAGVVAQSSACKIEMTAPDSPFAIKTTPAKLGDHVRFKCSATTDSYDYYMMAFYVIENGAYKAVPTSHPSGYTFDLSLAEGLVFDCVPYNTTTRTYGEKCTYTFWSKR